MRNGPRASALAAGLCLLTAFAASAQQPAPTNLQPRVTVAGKKAAISHWFRAESPHFVVYSDAGEDDVAQLLGNLEKLEVTGNRFRVPRWNVLERGTEATLRWLRGRVPVAEMAEWKAKSEEGEDSFNEVD